MASIMTPQDEMLFVVSSTAEITQNSRKLIRSHVMKGKNTGKRRKRFYRGIKSSQSPTSLSEKCVPSIPQKVGTEFSLIRFADSVDSSSVANLLTFASAAKKTLFPLEICFNFPAYDPYWLQGMSVDRLYVHSHVFVTHVYFDLLQGRTFRRLGEGASPNFMKTLRFLRERLLLADESSQVSDNTLTTVVCLFYYAHIKRDYTTARQHLRGLHHMVSLRGGLEMLQSHVKLLLEVLRCDITTALHSGERPLFNTSSRSLVPYLESFGWTVPNRIYQSNTRTAAYDALKALDTELFKTFESFRTFCLYMNHAKETSSTFPLDVLVQSMVTFQYRLVNLRFPRGTLDETFRLGLLAFSSIIFLKWRDIKLRYDDLTNSYRDSLFSSLQEKEIPSTLMLWLLVVGSILFAEETNDSKIIPSLQNRLQMGGVKNWQDLKTHLSEVLWIDFIHTDKTICNTIL